MRHDNSNGLGDCTIHEDHVNIEYDSDTNLLVCNRHPYVYANSDRIKRISFFSNSDNVQGSGFNMTYIEG